MAVRESQQISMLWCLLCIASWYVRKECKEKILISIKNKGVNNRKRFSPEERNSSIINPGTDNSIMKKAILRTLRV